MTTSREKTSDILSTIETLYSIALSPGQYESIAEGIDHYFADLDPESEQALQLRQHIDKALSILEQLHVTSDVPSLPEDIVAAEHGPSALVDVDGKFVARNDLWLAQYGKKAFSVWSLSDDEAGSERIRSAMRTLHEISEHRTSFVRLEKHDGRYINLSISRLVQRAVDDLPKRYLFRTGEAIWSDAISDLITSEFDLTPAETTLLKRMVMGDTFAEISDQTGKAVETLKSQSKSIYRKMHANGREDAVRIAYQLHVLLKSGEHLRKSVNRPNKMSVQIGRSQRVLTWRTAGKSGGKRVLFLHGMGLGYGLTEEFERELVNRKIELICLDRPGYGGSDPASNIHANVDEWAEAFPKILDELGIERAPILTHTSGVLYGCVAASRHPERVSKVSAMAGGVPIIDSYMLADYPLQIRLLSRASRFSPQLLRFVFSTFAASYRSEKGRNKIISRTYGGVPSDEAALRDPKIAQLVHEGMSLIVGTGFDGFIGDGLRIFNDWSEYVDDLQVPLHYIIGQEDPICPLKWAESFAQRFGHVTVSSVPKAGQLLHHTKPQKIFDILDETDFWDFSPWNGETSVSP